MSIIRVIKNKNNPYLIMNKTGLNDSRLSLKAKGLLCYLLSKPDNWYINTLEIVKNNSNGLESIRSAINELVRYGYMHKHRFRNHSGTFFNYNYLVYECPSSSFCVKTDTSPQTGFPVLVNPVMDNPPLLINKTKEINRTSLTTEGIKSNNAHVVQEDFIPKGLKDYVKVSLYELGIKDHKIFFDNFPLNDIFDYTDWMQTFRSRVRNPTGFLLTALKEKWADPEALKKSRTP